ncbi:hypothetical protein [Nannocystis pusilla]|uniref:hypothetical protein n=1 Tax=Nannocystis pusilla TaxID=889268 RepID=UPI003B7FB6E1
MPACLAEHAGAGARQHALGLVEDLAEVAGEVREGDGLLGAADRGGVAAELAQLSGGAAVEPCQRRVKAPKRASIRAIDCS